MTLISILLGLALVYFLGPLDRFRDFSWFEQYSQWLESRCNRIKLWDGPTGVVLTLALPLCLLLIVTSWLGSLSLIFPFIISIVVFVYSLGADPNRYFDSLISILADQDEESLKDMLRDLGLEPENIDQAGILRALLLKTHENLFGVIFWFIVLGITGALLYALAETMYRRYSDIHGGFARSVCDLHRILMWPSARLLALGFALGGSLVDALEGWRSARGESLECSEDVICRSGLGAMQFQPEPEHDGERHGMLSSSLLQGLQAIINRTLIVWLTVLGIMTIANWLS